MSMSKEDLIALLEKKNIDILYYEASREVHRSFDLGSPKPKLTPDRTTYISLELAMTDKQKTRQIRINPIEAGMRACSNCSLQDSCPELKACQFKETPEYLTCDCWE